MILLWLIFLNFSQGSVFNLDAANSEIQKTLGAAAPKLFRRAGVDVSAKSVSAVPPPSVFARHTAATHLSAIPIIENPLLKYAHASSNAKSTSSSQHQQIFLKSFDFRTGTINPFRLSAPDGSEAAHPPAAPNPKFGLRPSFGWISSVFEFPHLQGYHEDSSSSEVLVPSSQIQNVTLLAKNSTTPAEKNEVPVPEIKDIDKYIKGELLEYKISRLAMTLQLRKIISFIYNNDYTGFIENEDNFTQVFKYKPYLLKRKNNSHNYIGHYIIRFGATNFLQYIFCTSKSVDIGDAFEHLVQTKDLDTVVQMLSTDRTFDPSDLERLSSAIEDKYPNLSYFNYIFFEMKIRSGPIFTLSRELVTTSVLLDRLTILDKILKNEKFIDIIQNESLACKRFTRIPLMLPKYFMTLDLHIKQFLAKKSIMNNEFEIFKKIIELEPMLLLRVDHVSQTLLHCAICHSNLRFVSFILELVPEVLFVDLEYDNSHIKAAIQHGNPDILKELERFYVTYDRPLIRTHEKLMNCLQYSLKIKSVSAFAYYIGKAGKEEAVKFVLDMFGSYSELSKHVLGDSIYFDQRLVTIFIRNLGFSFKSTIGRSESDPATPILLISQDQLDFLRQKGSTCLNK